MIMRRKPNIEFKVYSFRRFGEPRLSKPKELKGIKQAFSIDYIPKKCKCPVFVNAQDVWVKHRDYFSPSYISMQNDPDDLGKPLSYLVKKYLDKDMAQKFAYSDAWGDIIARQEAWLVIKNLVNEIEGGMFPPDIVNEIREQQEKIHSMEQYDLCCTDMERFWEKVVLSLSDIF